VARIRCNWGGEMLHEIGERAVHLWFADYVIVIKDQEQLLASAGQDIDERL